MEHRKIRTTKVSISFICYGAEFDYKQLGTRDIDLFLQLNGNITHMQLRNKILPAQQGVHSQPAEENVELRIVILRAGLIIPIDPRQWSVE